jgi:hypothetical protein
MQSATGDYGEPLQPEDVQLLTQSILPVVKTASEIAHLGVGGDALPGSLAEQQIRDPANNPTE